MDQTSIQAADAEATTASTLKYMPGFGNDFETESLPGALPQGQNSPQKCNYGLYAEQLSGSPFTAPRGTNERSWLYRIRPSVRHTRRFSNVSYPLWKTAPCLDEHSLPLGQLRWDPIPAPEEKLTFLEGVRTMTTAGDAVTQVGMSAHAYVFNEDMVDDYFFNADGELLIVPQLGAIRVFTEMGIMDVEPLEICLVPRGMMFKITTVGEQAVWRGYICENYGAKFTLPDRGPIGANCLANPRDFKTPVAAFEDKEKTCRVHVKWCGKFYVTEIGHSPLDVVAWHGNYAPYKYDLRTFSPVGAISFDHPDPSIFSVLTAPTEDAGTANVDFVIFPPRWLVAEHTFRPPWYHRNIMSEFMGLIHGQYDAKEEGFVPGGISLHNMMLPHGPDALAFEKASNAELKAVKLDHTMAFMFETRYPQQLTKYAAELETLQDDYLECWDGLERKFDGTPGIK
ncbi:homogentisate 1,2-dioxygenase [Rhizobium bangladeshense]|uniref:Homogentisate 1,2-dioxygenase n=1 Tax=Rhizobium bangladeshense TaxID=1138189 RepID=A0ABS7LIC7_9HYPH|nr:homogentisate 1,2-dioxygenase [Rhizobium bangladeshense]MBX4871242.1 homogentisate 1,2-dioxygenase [Rhizobium bangladeshense]MBX4872498.1 homogentisate 1,2-dioxygenase [Rhizobium bangladeshense]MBX4887685.1 homogentisate 1,2-dioxygenase [Rhizobium bangladeshense]MBX4893686.1 homogentisate 1,2-dioxygenase [Rhizobium bangladeshense]MBX4899441.1 homogentisate 1,2-dioxygenase [Rhizobium bangladeshense]